MLEVDEKSRKTSFGMKANLKKSKICEIIQNALKSLKIIEDLRTRPQSPRNIENQWTRENFWNVCKNVRNCYKVLKMNEKYPKNIFVGRKIKFKKQFVKFFDRRWKIQNVSKISDICCEVWVILKINENFEILRKCLQKVKNC